MKCYLVLFTKDGIKHNIGNYLIISIILINICLLIIFLIKEYKILFNKIDKLIKNQNESIDSDNIEKNKNEINKIDRN